MVDREENKEEKMKVSFGRFGVYRNLGAELQRDYRGEVALFIGFWWFMLSIYFKEAKTQ